MKIDEAAIAPVEANVFTGMQSVRAYVSSGSLREAYGALPADVPRASHADHKGRP